jgi:uncharacterized protein YkwD
MRSMGRLPRALLLLLSFAAGASSACGDDEPTITPPPAECRVPEPNPCATDIGSTLPYASLGTTLGREDGFGGASCGLGGDTIEDMAFRWTAPSADTYLFSTEGSVIDTFLSLRQGGCLGRELECNDDAGEGSTHSEIEIELSACETITIVVDGPSVDAVGDFRISINGTEKLCDDGGDDDGDGLVDCADPDCFGASCRGPDTWPTEWADIEWEVLDLVNMHRAAGATCVSGAQPPAPPLAMDDELRLAARLHSDDMLENGYFSHDSPDGRMLLDRIAEAGFMGAGPIGENIVAGTRTAEGAVAAWMGSEEGHCENIMNPSYRVIGIGWAMNASDARGTQDFAGGP